MPRWSFPRTSGKVIRGAPTTRRLSSFPLLSGDSFAFACDTFPFNRPFQSADEADRKTRAWFVELSDLEDPSNRERLLELALCAAERPQLVLHNGDLVPPPAFFADALEVFERVCSVNLVAETDRLSGIPIGLENHWHRGTREFADYLSGYASLRSPEEEVEYRPRTILAAYREVTNPAERGQLSMKLTARGILNEPLDRGVYRQSLREAMFVLSPPGNGHDCHRTWEAIYLGAVPVVLRSTLAPSLIEHMPMVAVDEWEEVLDLSQTALEELYVATRTGFLPGACLMPWWLDRIGVRGVAG